MEISIEGGSRREADVCHHVKEPEFIRKSREATGEGTAFLAAVKTPAYWRLWEISQGQLTERSQPKLTGQAVCAADNRGREVGLCLTVLLL